MNFPRRRALQLAAGALAWPFTNSIARADDYPNRVVRFIVGFPAGGSGDIGARLMCQALSERLGQQFIVENRPGASTNIATEIAVRAPPDGYTLYSANITNTINASVFPNLQFNFARDMMMVAGLLRYPLILEVHPASPITTIADLIARAKADPGKLTLASFGTATSSHLSGELFKMLTGTQMLHVPYKGAAPMLIDLMGGHVDAAIDALPASVPLIKSGKVRALGVTSAKRSELLPDIPSIAEFVPGLDIMSWAGVGTATGTPMPVVEKLNREIDAVLADPKIKARIAEIGATPFPSSPAELTRLVAEETEKWAKVVKFTGIKAE